MEQVASPKVVDIINEVRNKNTSLVSYAIINFQDLGVPQSRKRVICGPPWLVAELVRRCGHSRRRSVQDVVTPRGKYIRDGSHHVGKRHGKAFIGNTGPRYFKAGALQAGGSAKPCGPRKPPTVLGLARRRTYKTHMPEHTGDGCAANVPRNVRLAGKQMSVHAIHR
eukprot:1153264-Prymnesium_polylepis.2